MTPACSYNPPGTLRSWRLRFRMARLVLRPGHWTHLLHFEYVTAAADGVRDVPVCLTAAQGDALMDSGPDGLSAVCRLLEPDAIAISDAYLVEAATGRFVM